MNTSTYIHLTSKNYLTFKNSSGRFSLQIVRRLLFLSMSAVILTSCGDKEEEILDDPLGAVDITFDVLESGQDCSDTPLMGSWQVVGVAPNGLPEDTLSSKPEGESAFELDDNCRMVNQTCNQEWDFSPVITGSSAEIHIKNRGFLDESKDDIFGCMPHDYTVCKIQLFSDSSMVIDCSADASWPEYVVTFRRL